jgi:hypothetical protein
LFLLLFSSSGTHTFSTTTTIVAVAKGIIYPHHTHTRVRMMMVMIMVMSRWWRRCHTRYETSGGWRPAGGVELINRILNIVQWISAETMHLPAWPEQLDLLKYEQTEFGSKPFKGTLGKKRSQCEMRFWWNCGTARTETGNMLYDQCVNCSWSINGSV